MLSHRLNIVLSGFCILAALTIAINCFNKSVIVRSEVEQDVHILRLAKSFNTNDAGNNALMDNMLAGYGAPDNGTPYWADLQKEYAKMLQEPESRSIQTATDVHSMHRKVRSSLDLAPSESRVFQWLSGTKNIADQELQMSNEQADSVQDGTWKDVSQIHSEIPKIQYSETQTELKNAKLARELAAFEGSRQMQSKPPKSNGNHAVLLTGLPVSNHLIVYPSAPEATTGDILRSQIRAQDVRQRDTSLQSKSSAHIQAKFGWRDILNMQSVVENMEKQLETTQTENEKLRRQLASAHQEGTQQLSGPEQRRQSTDQSIEGNSVLGGLLEKLRRNLVLSSELRRKLGAIRRVAEKKLLRPKTDSFLSGPENGGTSVRTDSPMVQDSATPITAPIAKLRSDRKFVKRPTSTHLIETGKVVHPVSGEEGSYRTKANDLDMNKSHDRSLRGTSSKATAAYNDENIKTSATLRKYIAVHDIHEDLQPSKTYTRNNASKLEPAIHDNPQGAVHELKHVMSSGRTIAKLVKHKTENIEPNASASTSSTVSNPASANLQSKIHQKELRRHKSSDSLPSVSAAEFRKSSPQIKEKVEMALAADEEASLQAESDAIFGDSKPVDERGNSVRRGFDHLHSLEASVLKAGKPAKQRVSEAKDTARTQQLTSVQVPAPATSHRLKSLPKSEHGADLADSTRGKEGRQEHEHVTKGTGEARLQERGKLSSLVERKLASSRLVTQSPAAKLKAVKTNLEPTIQQKQVETVSAGILGEASKEEDRKAAAELKKIQEKIKLGEIKKRALEFVAALERIPGSRKTPGRAVAHDTSDDLHEDAFRI